MEPLKYLNWEYTRPSYIKSKPMSKIGEAQSYRTPLYEYVGCGESHDILLPVPEVKV